MKASYVLSFLCGAAVMLGLSTQSGSQSSSILFAGDARLEHAQRIPATAMR
jgi:hypothetical protein